MRISLTLVLLCFVRTFSLAQEILPLDSTQSMMHSKSGVPVVEQAQETVSMRASPSSVFSKDSLSLFEYHTIGDIIALIPGYNQYSLGSFGQPMWVGTAGAHPNQFSLSRNGTELPNILGRRSDPYSLSIEDASTVTLYSMHESFWYGGNGILLTANMQEKDWNSSHPVTYLRHTEAPNDYLFTDAIFNINPTVLRRDNLHLGVTRRTIGVTTSDNSARFRSNRAESWDVRAKYRFDLSEQYTITVYEYYDDHLIYLNAGIKGTLDSLSGVQFYDAQGSSFSNEAFDPVVAVLNNPTMRSKEERNNIGLSALWTWSTDSSQISRMDVSFTHAHRSFGDNLHLLSHDSVNVEKSERDERWRYARLALSHSFNLNWSSLFIEAVVQSYASDVDRILNYAEGVTSSVKGKIHFQFFGSSLTGLARLENAFDQNSVGIGATMQTRIAQKFALWAGGTFSSRPYTLFELALAKEAAWYQSGMSLPLENNIILEGGIKASLGDFETDLRLFVRNTTTHYTLETGTVEIVDGFTRFSSTLIQNNQEHNLWGGNWILSGALWFLTFSTGTSVCFPLGQNAGNIDLDSPRFDASLSLFYRGELINGTLDIKGGITYSFRDAFLPLSYDPSLDIFGTFHSAKNSSGAISSYTDAHGVDLFFFATIKKAATIHLILHNALDYHDITTLFYPMYERGLRFGVEWKLLD